MELAPERARSISRRFIEEVFNHGRLDLIEDLVAEDAVEHEELPITTGEMRTDLRTWVAELRRAFPDYRIVLEDLIVEGDKVAMRERITGTHDGPFMGIPPTGRRIDVEAFDIVRIADDRVVEHWGISDGTTMVRQLGLGGDGG